MSNQNHVLKKILASVALIAIVLVVFVFLINKTIVWQNSDNNPNPEKNVEVKINPDGFIASAIKDRREISKIIYQLGDQEKTEDLNLMQAVSLMDRLVENSNVFFIARLDYKELGVESEEFENSLDAYYNSVIKSINVLNSTEWQKVSDDKFVIVATVQNSKNKMFNEFYTTLNNLDKVFEEMDKLVVVDLDKPFQCGLPNTRIVYLCENGYYKIINYSGFEFYDDQGQKVDNCKCKEIKCFEDNNLCN
ncbi:MAG: hypothetical protein ABIA91_02605 [Patescibacteria group bacterium]